MAVIFVQLPDRLNFSLPYAVCSAVTATLIHDAISNPTEVIKQRLQMYNSPYKTVFQCARGVFKNEGFKAFYRSYATQLFMNLPHQALHFTTYEFFQNMVSCAQLGLCVLIGLNDVVMIARSERCINI